MGEVTSEIISDFRSILVREIEARETFSAKTSRSV